MCDHVNARANVESKTRDYTKQKEERKKKNNIHCDKHNNEYTCDHNNNIKEN